MLQPEISKNDLRFMQLALEQAKMAYDKDEVPIGAIITVNNQIIARSFNMSKTLNDPTAHAEMQAYTIATDTIGGRSLNECTLYVTLEPCAMCLGASYWVKIGRIVFGAYDKKRNISNISESILHPKTIIQGGVMAEESEKLLQTFFAKKR